MRHCNNYITNHKSQAKRITSMKHEELRASFGRLVEEYQSPLRRYLWYLTHGDAAAADDLAQDTFIKAYERLETYRGGSFKAWLFTIAFRTYLDTKRSQKTFVSTDGIAYHTAYASAQPEGEILEAALNCLDDTEKNLVLLSAVEGLSHSEIAKTTGLPLGSVKGVIKRAKGKLKTHLHYEERE